MHGSNRMECKDVVLLSEGEKEGHSNIVIMCKMNMMMYKVKKIVIIKISMSTLDINLA